MPSKELIVGLILIYLIYVADMAEYLNNFEKLLDVDNICYYNGCIT